MKRSKRTRLSRSTRKELRKSSLSSSHLGDRYLPSLSDVTCPPSLLLRSSVSHLAFQIRRFSLSIIASHHWTRLICNSAHRSSLSIIYCYTLPNTIDLSNAHKYSHSLFTCSISPFIFVCLHSIAGPFSRIRKNCVHIPLFFLRWFFVRVVILYQ